MIRLLLLLSLLLLAPAGSVAAQEREEPVTTPVRASLHADRYRLAMDFIDRPEYSVRVEGRQLILEFERPVLLDFEPARRQLGERLGAPRVSEFGRRFTLPLGDGRRVSDTVSGSRILLDFFPYPPPPPPPPPVIAYGLAYEGFDRLVFSFVSEVTATLESGEGSARMTVDARGAIDRSAFDLRGLKLVTGARGDLVDDRLVVEVEAAPDARFHLRNLGDVVELDVAGPGVELQRDAPLIRQLGEEPALPDRALAAPLHDGPTQLPLGEGLTVEVSRPLAPRRAPAPGHSPAWPSPLAIAFAWSQPTGLAALLLEEGLLLVFDQPAPEALTETLRGADPLLAGLRSLPVSGATALLLPLVPPMRPAIELEEGRWYVDLRPREMHPLLGPPMSRRDGEQGPELRLAAAGGRRVVDLDLAEAGGRLSLVPLAAAGQAVPQALRLPQMTLLPTLQGLALRPLADGLQLAVDSGGVTFSAAEGLILSDTLGEGQRAAGATWREGRQATLPLLDLPAWRLVSPADYEEQRRRLQDAVLAAEPDRVGLERLRLARFHFAHGLGAETLGTLRLLSEEDPVLAADPEVQLLLGAALLLDGRVARAAEPLASRLLDGEVDAWLWRAALAAEARDWLMADLGFLRAAARIPEYARPVRARLRLDAAEAALEAGDAERAEQQLELAALDVGTRPEETRLAYLQGRNQLLVGDETAARGALRRAADGTATAAGARARLLLLDLDLAAEAVTPAEAAAALEQLTYAWRGDAFEFELARRLSDLQWQAGQPRASLRTLRQAITTFPEAGEVDAAAAVLAERFHTAMLELPEETLPALSGLALYEEFRELTPAGEAGERLISSLAERLVRMDLLERAAALLEHQVDFRLAGEPKARAGVKLAEVLLLDRRPREALMALDRSAAAELPPELGSERRLLRARALAASGRLEQGLGLLDQDDSRASTELRAELLWEAGEWRRVAPVLRDLLPPRSEQRIDDATALRLLRAAVAFTLAGDPAAIVRLRESHGHQLRGGPFEEVFALLAENNGQRSVAGELAAVEQVQAFMAQYREETDDEGQLSASN